MYEIITKLNYSFVGRLGVDTRTEDYLCVRTLYTVPCPVYIFRALLSEYHHGKEPIRQEVVNG